MTLPNIKSTVFFLKTLQAHQDKSELTLREKQKQSVVIYILFLYYGDKRFQLIKSYIHKIKVNCKNDQPVVYKILCIGKKRYTITAPQYALKIMGALLSRILNITTVHLIFELEIFQTILNSF